jgi:hypothetical protein
MSDMMNEIEDDLRHQKLVAFWKENGPWIIGGAIMAVVMTGFMVFWQNHTAEKNTAATQELFKVVVTDDAQKISAYAETAGKNHAAVARFAAAARFLENGDKAKAEETYAEIRDMSGIDSTWKDLASLLSIRNKFETAESKELHKELSGLTGKKGVFRFSALEMEALLYARDGDNEKAAALLADIAASANAPADVRTRALTLRELYLGGKT